MSANPKLKKFTHAEKKAYYEKRKKNNKLHISKRNYAERFLSGSASIDAMSNTPLDDKEYMKRRRDSAKTLIRDKVGMRKRYLELERSGDTNYVRERHDNDRAIAYFKGQYSALNDKLKKTK